MDLFKFANKKGDVALSNDKNGSNLPEADGPWESVGKIDLGDDDVRIGASTDDIKAGIERDGFFLWPQPD